VRVQIPEVISLEEGITKLRKRKSRFCPPLHALLRKEVRDGKVLSYLSEELYEGECAEPLVVIADDEGVGKEFLDLGEEGVGVRFYDFWG
jgi:hypothetical protein